jgi:hypothetical protein
MEIIYTKNSIEGEPGPTLYWRGSPPEYFKLLTDLHPLGVSSGTSFELQNLSYVRLTGIKSYKLLSLNQGNILAQVRNDAVLSELDPRAWGEFLHKILTISFGRGYVYQDQEDLSRSPLTENPNIIMSSEF